MLFLIVALTILLMQATFVDPARAEGPVATTDAASLAQR
jgi:hypothetical protein